MTDVDQYDDQEETTVERDDFHNDTARGHVPRMELRCWSIYIIEFLGGRESVPTAELLSLRM